VDRRSCGPRFLARLPARSLGKSGTGSIPVLSANFGGRCERVRKRSRKPWVSRECGMRGSTPPPSATIPGVMQRRHLRLKPSVLLVRVQPPGPIFFRNDILRDALVDCILRWTETTVQQDGGARRCRAGGGARARDAKLEAISWRLRSNLSTEQNDGSTLIRLAPKITVACSYSQNTTPKKGRKRDQILFHQNKWYGQNLKTVGLCSEKVNSTKNPNPNSIIR